MNISENMAKAAIALLFVPGLGQIRYKRLLEIFDTPEAVFSAEKETIAQSFGDAFYDKIMGARENPAVQTAYDMLRQMGADILIWGQPGYPERLLNIYAAPPVLFVRGQLLPQDERAIAIVGTRRLSHNGEKTTFQLASELAKAGVTIVSGLAVGIDGIAHKAALEAGGRTIAIMASGLDIVYPPMHKDLAQKIIEHGALVSEFLPRTKPEAHNFPRRNRIISGISLGVVIAEAGEKSGALISAQHAIEQSRELFAVPGSPTAPKSVGTNRLIRDGARIIVSAQDILEALSLPSITPQKLDEAVDKVKKLTGASKVIFEALSNEPMHIDEIARICKIETSYALAALFALEIEGLVCQLPGKRFTRNM